MAATETKERRAEERGPGASMEMDATQAAPRSAEQCADIFTLVLVVPVIFFMLCIMVWAIWAGGTYKEPEYSVAIAAVSGLHLTAPDRPVLDPEFNLTVRIAVRSPLLRPCGLPPATVQVSYRGFALASAPAPQVCEIRDEAEKGRTVVRTVVARGARVWLPGPALDGLAADVRRAAGVFDVTLTIPGYTKLTHDDGLVVSCMGRPIGDDGGGGALCDVSALHNRRAG